MFDFWCRAMLAIILTGFAVIVSMAVIILILMTIDELKDEIEKWDYSLTRSK